MLLVASLFTIKDRNAGEFFVRSVRRGGSWQTAASRIAPDLIQLDVFEPGLDSPKAIYLCLDLWKSAEAYHRASVCPEAQSLFLARRHLADCSLELGVFLFASTPDAADTPQPCIH